MQKSSCSTRGNMVPFWGKLELIHTSSRQLLGCRANKRSFDSEYNSFSSLRNPAKLSLAKTPHAPTSWLGSFQRTRMKSNTKLVP